MISATQVGERRELWSRLTETLHSCCSGAMDEGDYLRVTIDHGERIEMTWQGLDGGGWHQVGSTKQMSVDQRIADGQAPFEVYRVGRITISMVSHVFSRVVTNELRFHIDATVTLPRFPDFWLKAIAEQLYQVAPGLCEQTHKETLLRSLMLVMGRVIPLTLAPIATSRMQGEPNFNLERATPPTPGVFGEGMERMLYRNPPRRL